MMKNITKLFYGAIFSTLFILAACTGTGNGQIDPGDEPDPAGGATVGLANPSAVYCEGLGYSMENVIREGGQDADCLFPDGSRCAAWDFLAGRCGQPFSFCEGQGFTIEAVNNIATCRFPDGSTCDEFAYFSGECSPGENPDVSEAPVQITDSAAARDFIAAYLADRYGVEHRDPWLEQDITPQDAAGTYRVRYVSGPLTIVISAPASAPAPSEYVIEEASLITNGFYWAGTLSFHGEVVESEMLPPATVLNEAQARDQIVAYLIDTHDLSFPGEWTDQGVSPSAGDRASRVFTSGPWVVEVEFAPAAPLVSGYHVTVDNLSEETRWQGEISLHSEIVEISYSE